MNSLLSFPPDHVLERTIRLAQAVVCVALLLSDSSRTVFADEQQAPSSGIEHSSESQIGSVAHNRSKDIEHSPHVPEQYQLVWNEEFDGSQLDHQKWGYRSEGQSSDGSGCSKLCRKSVSLDGKGNLVLKTREVDGQLHTSMISTNDKFEPVYGYFESRIQFQRLQGHHGAFWLKPRSFGKYPGDPGRSGVEVDIAEFFGKGRYDGGLGINLYWKNENNSLASINARLKLKDLLPVLMTSQSSENSDYKEFCEGFHVFSCKWTPKGYSFFVDGHKLFETNEGVSHQGQPIILSLLSHKWETDKLERSSLKSDAMFVDYVRVYQECPNSIGALPRETR